MIHTFEGFYLNVELLNENVKVPERANDDDAGMDVFTPVNFSIAPGSDNLIPLGWKCEFPKGYALVFKEKSGIATKKKLDIGACVVDAGYRGEVHIHLFNNSNSTVVFDVGDKVAQFLIVPVWHGDAVQVDSVSDNTTRGEGGFGSTGK